MYFQLLVVIFTLNSSNIALLTICISYWAYTDLYCFFYWATLENIAPAAKPIQRMNSSNIALPERTILEEVIIENKNVCDMTQVWIYCET